VDAHRRAVAERARQHVAVVYQADR